jgi:hypothetical protein
MRRFIFPAAVFVFIFFTLFSVFRLLGFVWPRITQDIQGESDGTFTVRTSVIYNGLIVQKHYTWQDMGTFKGLPAEKIDSAKKANYLQAEQWIEQFKKIK